MWFLGKNGCFPGELREVVLGGPGGVNVDNLIAKKIAYTFQRKRFFCGLR